MLLLLDLESGSQRPPRPAGGESSVQGSGTGLLAFYFFIYQCILLFVALVSEALWPLPDSEGLDSGSLCLCLVV